MQKQIKKLNPGFTLLELLIYIAIFTIVMTILIQVLSGTFSIFAQVRSKRGLIVAGSTIIERMSHNIRAASSFSASGNTFDTDPSVMSLSVNDSSGVAHTYIYAKESSTNRLTEKVDSAAAAYLNGPGQTVTTFTVKQLTAGTSSGAVINLVLTDNRITPPISAEFTTTVLMRGGY